MLLTGCFPCAGEFCSCENENESWCYTLGSDSTHRECRQDGGKLVSGACDTSDSIAVCEQVEDCQSTSRYYYPGASDDLLLTDESNCFSGCHAWHWFIPVEERPGYSGKECSSNDDCDESERCHFETSRYCCAWSDQCERDARGICMALIDTCGDERASDGLCGCDGIAYANPCLRVLKTASHETEVCR